MPTNVMKARSGIFFPGVVKVVREGSFVGVVAETEWAAIQARTGAEGDLVDQH